MKFDRAEHRDSPSLADFQQDMRRGYIWGATWSSPHFDRTPLHS